MSFLTRNNYYPMLYINNVRVSDSIIDGATITIRKVENEAAIMTITLRPGTGAQSLTYYPGLPIFLNVQIGGNIYRQYTGIIDIDSYDIQKETITIQCTDDRTNRINSELSAYVDTVGYFSTDLFGIPKDTSLELENRLTTIPYSFDFDNSGVKQLTAWAPKSSPDYTLGDSDIYNRELSIKKTYRNEVINKVNITLTYQYERLHHRQRGFTWSNNLTACQFLTGGYTLCSKDMIRQAIISAGWPLYGDISFTNVYSSGMYRCVLNSPGAQTVSIGWIGSTSQGLNYVQQDTTIVNGIVTPVTQYDSAGNVLSQSATKATVNTADLYCIGATWQATKRFSQNIKEQYTLTVQAPQSQTQFGTIAQSEQGSIRDTFDSSYWEKQDVYKALSAQDAADAVSVLNTSSLPTADYFIDKDTDRTHFNLMCLAMINRAKTTILKSHRKNRVQFTRSYWPYIDLKHTVQLNTTKVTAKGKVYSIEHNITVGTGEATTKIELALYKSIGSQSESTFSIPNIPSYIPTIEHSLIGLDSHYGMAPQGEWNGYIGNKISTINNNTFKTDYPEQFRVDVPAIESEFRDNKTLTNSQTYNVSIPNNTLSITFNGKLDE